MYVVQVHKSCSKAYNTVIKKFNISIRERMITTLTNDPYSLDLRKGLRRYKLPQAHRALIKLYESPKNIALIIFIGNHSTYMKFLRKYR